MTGARLTDDEPLLLADLVDNNEIYQGQSETRTSSYDGWSSDGKYTREVTVTHTFTDDVGIRTDSSYRDDDGQERRVKHRDEGRARHPELAPGPPLEIGRASCREREEIGVVHIALTEQDEQTS